MDTLSRNEINILLATPQRPCVSILFSTRLPDLVIKQGRIRLKNMLREAENLLEQRGYRTGVRELLKPVYHLLEDYAFWQGQDGGIAIFRSPEVFQAYHLPLQLEEKVTVGDNFFLKPVLPLLTGGDKFYILALSQNKVTLYSATRTGIAEQPLPPEVPASLDEALRLDVPEKLLEFHPGTSRGRGLPAQAQYYGHGSIADITKENLDRFFHLVDKGLHNLFKGEQAPLILACVNYEYAVYRELNTYPYLVEDWVAGNPDELKPEELQRKAWQKVEPYFLKRQGEAIARYKELVSSGRTSNDLRRIVEAAFQGRVEVLFVAGGREKWGRFDPKSGQTHLHPVKEVEDEEILNLAAVHTLGQHGTIYTLEPEQMPEGADLAAIYRF